MKTSDLIGPALDWAVAKCEGATNTDCISPTWIAVTMPADWDGGTYEAHLSELNYSTDWSQGGPIIERERILIEPHSQTEWCATYKCPDAIYDGPTPLIAAMRCYVASRLGDEVEIPEELL